MMVQYYYNETGWGWREGQAAFNALVEYRSDLSEQIRCTDRDPFYDDRKLFKFYEWVAERW